MRLGLVEGAVFDERAREVPPRGPVLGDELDDVPELCDGVVPTAQGHVGDPQLHQRADVVRARGEKPLQVDDRLVEFLLPQQRLGEKPVHIAV